MRAIKTVSIGVAAALICFLLILHWWNSRDPSITTAPSHPPLAQPASLQDTEEYLRLEAAERQRDATVWAEEMDALKHGQWIHDFWDKLNADHSFNFAIADPDLKNIAFMISANSSNRSSLQSLLAGLRDAGWLVIQSEWHHVRFVPATLSEPARSTLSTILHARRGAETTNTSTTLAAVELSIEISWNLSRENPAPAGIKLLSQAVQLSTNKPAFQMAFETSIDSRLPGSDQRLLCQDLDADGFPDLVLPTANQVLWNHGGFKFEARPLFNSPKPSLKASVLADLDRDGRWDLIAADDAGLWFHQGLGKAGFAEKGLQIWHSPRPLENPFVLTTADFDGDGELDFFLAQYKPPVVGGQMPTPWYDANDGFSSWLLRSDSTLHCVDETEASGLANKRFRRTYSAAFLRLPGEIKPGLAVASDFAGLDIYRNSGGGMFQDSKSAWAPQASGFGMALAFADFNHDGRLDLWMSGMNSDTTERLTALGLRDPRFPGDPEYFNSMTWGNRLLLSTSTGFVQATSEFLGPLRKTGWTWGTVAFDADNDGRLDLYLANGHISRNSTRDYEPRFWRHDIHAAASRASRPAELLLSAALARNQGSDSSYAGHQLNRLLMGTETNGWMDRGWIEGVALPEDSRNVLAVDFNQDGNLDLAVVTRTRGPAGGEQLRIFCNNHRKRNWLGITLEPTPNGRRLETCVVHIEDESGDHQTRTIINGDGYLSQHPSAVHFGLGEVTRVNRATISFSDGSEVVIKNPPVNQWLKWREK